MMDIHRCRFVPYPTSAINAVAFSHASLLDSKRPKAVQVRLALGRANGDLEIWNPLNGVWYQEMVIPGGQERSIDSLVWVTDPDEVQPSGKTILGRSRLFSIGYTTTITEWDLENARVKKYASGQHGDIWCLGAQPLPTGDATKATRKLVAGTVDGTLLLYSIEDNDLQFQRIIVKISSKRSKMVSIAFQSRNIAIVGCSNGAIRAYDIRNGTTLRQMNLGTDLMGLSKEIIVWSVKCLPNGDIVSGDSTGQVCIWDGKTYTQVQRIQGHTQDVLSLAVSADGSKIISGGMDKRTALYEPMSGRRGRWAKVFHRKYHSHDVKAMASFEGKGMSVVVSGGPDASPVVLPLKGAGREHHRTLTNLPQGSPFQSAPKSRFLVSWWDNEVSIWRLANLAQQATLDQTLLRKEPKLIKKILILGESNITSASVSSDGTLLVVATTQELKAFRLDLRAELKQDKKVTTISSLPTNRGASKVLISPDMRWLSWIEDGSTVKIAEITTQNSTYSISRCFKLKRLRRQIPKHILLGGLGAYDRNIIQITFSPDSKMLAVADLAGYIDTWIIRGPDTHVNGTMGTGDEKGDEEGDSASDSSSEEEGENKQSDWIRNPKARLLPKLSSTPVVFSFSNEVPGPASLVNGEESGGYTLLAIITSMNILVMNPLRGVLSDWSRRNGYTSLPEHFKTTRDLAKGVVWQGPVAWIYGPSFLFMLDLSQDLRPEQDEQKTGTKRKRGPTSGAGDRMDKHPQVPLRLKAAQEDGEWMDIDEYEAEQKGDASSAYEEDDEDTDGGELQLKRASKVNGERPEKKRPSWWHTYKYRSILGIVPLDGEQQEAGLDGLPALEVAVVEKP